jgi:hypothetical protein
MDKAKNPFRPGAGTPPPVVAGRNHELDNLSASLRQVASGSVARHTMFYGLRGVGKTVLLTEAEKLSAQNNVLAFKHEVSEEDDSAEVLARIYRKAILNISHYAKAKDIGLKALRVLKSFTVTVCDVDIGVDVDKWLGQADSGTLTADLSDLTCSFGDLCKDSGRSVAIIIDEAQYLSEDALRALIETAHRCNQKEYPIFFVCAGLPQIAGLAGDAKSYSERLFLFTEVSSLDVKGGVDYGVQALTKPFSDAGISFSEDAIRLGMDVTGRYPYFIQELGTYIWNLCDSDTVEVNLVDKAQQHAIQALDESFFKVRIDRSTNAEKNLMKAMAQCKGPTYDMGEVARAMKRKTQSLGPTRAQLISKGFVYAPSHGTIAFTVPHFDRFLLRHPEC